MRGFPGLHPRAFLIPLFMYLSLIIHPSIPWVTSYLWVISFSAEVSQNWFLFSCDQRIPTDTLGRHAKFGELQSREFGERLVKSWFFITSCNASLMPLGIACAFWCWQQGDGAISWYHAQSGEICLYWPTSIVKSCQFRTWTVICQHLSNSTVWCECTWDLELGKSELISG